jgi:hypothetical protein
VRASYFPEIVKEYFRGPPIRNPPENYESIGGNLCEGRGIRNRDKDVCSQIADCQHQNAGGEKALPHAKTFAPGAPKHFGAIGEIVRERLAKALLFGPYYFVSRQVNDDTKMRGRRKLLRPAHDESFGLVIEIALWKRRGIQRVEKLAEGARAKLYRWGFVRHGGNAFRAGSLRSEMGATIGGGGLDAK